MQKVLLKHYLSYLLNNKIRSKDYTSNFIFLIAIIITGLSFISVIFPALLIRLSSGSVFNPINPFETGIFSIPLLTSNIAIFGIWLLYKKNRIPFLLKNALNFIFQFEVSRRIAFISLVILLGIYVVFSVGELNESELDRWADYYKVVEDLQRWPPQTIEGISSSLHTKNFLLFISQSIFGNLRIIPFIGSICLLILVYFTTVELSKKRFAGLLSVVIVLQSNTFLLFDTLATYANFWSLLYLFSLYSIIKKKWYISPLSYVAAIFAKPLSAVFLPMTIFFIYRSDMTRNEKIKTIIGYGIIVIVFVVIFIVILPSKEGLIQSNILFHIPRFWSGFTILAFQFRYDMFILMLLLPVIVGLYLKSKSGIKHADSIMLLISGMIFVGPALTGLLNFQLNPYRLIPLVVFFAIGFGMLFSKGKFKITNDQESS